MRLQGKTAIVTGGAVGIGRAICQRFAAEGAGVVIVDIDIDGANTVAQDIVSRQGKAIAVEADVTNRQAVREAVEQGLAAFGRIDILVNNAGTGKIIPFLETTEADFDRLFRVNCQSVMICCQEVAQYLIEAKRCGKIINLASQAGRRGESLVMAYCATKAAVISMTQSIALALAPHKINVNAIAPGVVDTPLWEALDKQFALLSGVAEGEPIRKAISTIPLGRVEQPEDVAAAAVFLASSDADYITQQCLNVDGGNWPS
ncbi:glucose 1-dehydrogenase [Pelagicoccus sp. SDUM812003]|uniref:glucose 1-dehydrogenase n=1 Tax=Pelagicoccus sp. SDUM812003 TaxID=3041267 RepID=UPI00280E238D|nr:glucose 1-dehydrogenase [Pelagicoccus sp. SDUM812003]MDQ8201437.1 glucose 1-dehydrogenase [Pelagicoccus sp. SDUM812003]